jgi:hypothetical protein
MSRPTRSRSVRSVIALVAASVLGFVIAAPAAADPPDELLADFSTPAYSFKLTHAATNLGWFEVDITNLGAAPVSFGLGGGLQDPQVIQQLWLDEELEPDQPSMFSETVLPGESYHDQIPFWPGMPFEFFEDLSAPVSIGSYTVPGDWFPAVFDPFGEDAVIEIGHPVVITPATARAGESVAISTAVDAGLTSAEVRIGSGDTLGMNFGNEWDWSTDNTESLGTIAVAGGLASGSVVLPPTLVPGVYGIIVGDEATDRWVSGPRFGLGTVIANLELEAGAPRGSTPAGDNVPVTPVDATTGTQPVEFTFGSVTTPGTTTVTTSTTGPTPTGFELNGVYYELATTAAFTGPVTVCISYQDDGSGDLLSLFHRNGATWVDITTSSEVGRVCGSTTSFSPFALGVPTAPPTYPFSGFYAPVSITTVNTEFAGSIIPFRFSLGADLGKQIITSVVSGTSACTPGATPSAPQAASSPLGIKLQYVKSSGTYWWLWQTKAAWAGSCRTFVMTLDDGSTHAATFKFQKFTFGGLLRAILTVV